MKQGEQMKRRRLEEQMKMMKEEQMKIKE